MVDLERLAARARWANEWGRLRAAVRVAFVVVPCALASLLAGASIESVAPVGLGLLAACVTLRWWSGAGLRAVRRGLMVGAVPMAAGLLTLLLDTCDPRPALSPCGSLCLLAGVFAGVGLVVYASRRTERRFREWAQIGLVASLTTALGCVGLGVGSVVVVLTSLAFGSGLAWLPVARRS